MLFSSVYENFSETLKIAFHKDVAECYFWAFPKSFRTRIFRSPFGYLVPIYEFFEFFHLTRRKTLVKRKQVQKMLTFFWDLEIFWKIMQNMVEIQKNSKKLKNHKSGQKSKRASKNSSSQTFWKRSKIVFHKDVVEI